MDTMLTAKVKMARGLGRQTKDAARPSHMFPPIRPVTTGADRGHVWHHTYHIQLFTTPPGNEKNIARREVFLRNSKNILSRAVNRRFKKIKTRCKKSARHSLGV